MYLGKGIDGFTDRPVGPGQMWSTDNPDAAIHEFGGDADTPSEDHHIREIREAMDKTSGVSPLAAGVVGGQHRQPLFRKRDPHRVARPAWPASKRSA